MYKGAVEGRIAQRLERYVDIVEVAGSNPAAPTIISQFGGMSIGGTSKDRSRGG